jgi:hypothetical protein
MSTAASAKDDASGNFEYSVLGDDTATIDRVYSQEKEVVIPSTIEGHKVIAIGVRACTCKKNLEKLTISDGIKYIYDGAFEECKKLKSVTLPETVSEIDVEAFEDCESLTEIKLPSKLKKLGRFAFRKTALNKITFPKTLTKLDIAVFADTNIKEVKIPKNIKTIERNPFNSCQNLKSIKVDSSNKLFTSKNGILYNKKMDTLLCYPSGKTNTKYTVNSKVKKIGKSAFHGTTNLKNITFKKGIKKIGRKAFKNTGLTSVKFPNTLKSIGIEAFTYCAKLKKISIPTSVTTVDNDAFAFNDSLSKINFKGNSQLVMGSGVFRYNSALKEFKLPVCKKSYGSLCFRCENLKKVTISKKINRIYRQDFFDCKSLLSVTIPKSVKKIETRAFGYLTSTDDDAWYFKTKIVIRGYKNTAAQKYAKDAMLTFEKIV